MKSFIYVFIIVAVFISCANPKPLTGGEKDTKPPKIETSSPANYSTSVNPQLIIIEFDEPIQVNDITNNLFITPYIDNPFKSKVKRKKLYLEFEKPFEENTTYTIYFNNAIKDVTENNETKDLKYVFSTGVNLDSLKLKVEVLYPDNQEKCKQCLVSLYRSEDTLNIKNSKPIYFGYTKSDGNVTIENLKQGSYRGYTIEDKNNNFMYDEGEPISFSPEPIIIDTNTSDVKFSLIKKSTKDKQKINQTKNYDNVYQLQFQNNLKTFEIYDSTYNKIDLKYWYSNSNTINLELNDSLISGHIITQDSSNQIDTTIITLSPRKSKRFIDLQFSKKSLEPYQEIKIILSNKPNLIVDSLMYFLSDSSKIKNKGWKLDSNHNILIFKAPKELNSYKLHIDSAAIRNDRIACKEFENSIKLLEETETGIIKGKVECSIPTILELVDEKYNVIEKRYNPTEYIFDYLEPKNYKLRLILDDNNNRKWDEGNFEKSILPENIIFHSSSINLRKNWEIKDVNLKCPSK